MSLRAVVPAAFWVCAAVASAQGASQSASQATPSMTPGELLVIASQPPPTFAQTLITALEDPRPEMRLTAVRIIGVQNQTRFLPVLFQVRDRESDGATIQEVLRAIRVLGATPAAEPPVAQGRGRSNAAPTPTMTTATALYPGFFNSLLRATGCRASATTSLAAMSIAFRPNGNPESVGVSAETSAACRKAMLALAQATYTERAVTPGVRQWIVLPLDNEAVACADAAPGAFRPPSANESRLEPVKIRDASPRYPADARQAGVEGLVLLEATISPTGCVRDISVIRPIRISMDFAAISTVSQWRYTPTVSDGRAHAVRLTVSVDFRLESSDAR